MTAVVGREVICAVQVVIGVDTHQDEHVAVAIDQQGVRQKFARGRRGLVRPPVTATPSAPLRMPPRSPTTAWKWPSRGCLYGAR